MIEYPRPEVVTSAFLRAETDVERVLLDLPGATTATTYVQAQPAEVCTCEHYRSGHRTDLQTEKCDQYAGPNPCPCPAFRLTARDYRLSSTVRLSVQTQDDDA